MWQDKDSMTVCQLFLLSFNEMVSRNLIHFQKWISSITGFQPLLLLVKKGRSDGKSVCVRMYSLSITSKSLQPHGLEPARLLCPWNSPGKSTGAGCHSLQVIFLTQGSNLGFLHGRQLLYRLSHQSQWTSGNVTVLQGSQKEPTPSTLVRFHQDLRALV